MTKHLLLVLMIISFALKSQAQSAFTVERLDTTLYGLATTNTFYGDIDVFNNQGAAFLMHWETVEENVPLGWTTSVCDPAICHNVGVTSASFNLPVLPSGVNVHFYPNNVYGTGYIKVKLWVDTTPSDSVVLTYYGIAGATNLNKLTASHVVVFPNPTSSLLNVKLPELESSVHIRLIDLSGREVLQSSSQGGGFIQLDVAQLPQGMYMIQILTDKNVLITTRFLKE